MRRASTGLCLTGTTSWSYALAATTFCADDTYPLAVRATDSVGNASTATTAFVIDRAQPTAVGFSTTNILTARKLERETRSRSPTPRPSPRPRSSPDGTARRPGTSWSARRTPATTTSRGYGSYLAIVCGG